MAFYLSQIVASQFVSNAQTTMFTSQTGQLVRLDAISVANVDSVSRTISINIVAFGGAAGAGNLTTKLQSILPGQTWNSPNEVGKVLSNGDFLSVIASAANALVITVGGLIQL